LGYLDKSPEAVALVERWLAKDGLLSNVTGLNELGEAMLQNVAPVAPEALLGALERAPRDSLAGHSDFARLLRSLAYDPALFARSAQLLATMAEADGSGHQGEAGTCFEGLFFLILSGPRLSRYFLAQTGLNAFFGVVVAIGLALIGVPNAVLWGMLAALLRFVPYVGAFLAAAFPVALAFAVDPGWSMVLWTLALFFVLEPLVGQLLEPLLYGHSTGLTPVAVIISAIFWTWIWGPVGLILSTPLAVCLAVLGRHIESLRYVEVIIGNAPPLTPAQTFYQRASAAIRMKSDSLHAYVESRTASCPGAFIVGSLTATVHYQRFRRPYYGQDLSHQSDVRFRLLKSGSSKTSGGAKECCQEHIEP